MPERRSTSYNWLHLRQVGRVGAEELAGGALEADGAGVASGSDVDGLLAAAVGHRHRLRLICGARTGRPSTTGAVEAVTAGLRKKLDEESVALMPGQAEQHLDLLILSHS
jgi:hypothetical protein